MTLRESYKAAAPSQDLYKLLLSTTGAAARVCGTGAVLGQVPIECRILREVE